MESIQFNQELTYSIFQQIRLQRWRKYDTIIFNGMGQNKIQDANSEGIMYLSIGEWGEDTRFAIRIGVSKNELFR